MSAWPVALDPGRRRVEGEVLDRLAADDPRARRARADLWRIHRVMRTRTQLQAALPQVTPEAPRRVLEIGCGDARLLASMTAGLPWHDVELILLDRQAGVVANDALARFARAGWRVHVVQADVLDWLAQAPAVDVVVASLFLHHFTDAQLARLLAAVARVSRALVALEPRRGAAALAASHAVVLLGASRVTRGDAVLSVRAGFRGKELSQLWPDRSGWDLNEQPAWPFSHAFTARRREPT